MRQYQQLFIFSGEISSVECVNSNVKQCLLNFAYFQRDSMFASRGQFCEELRFTEPAKPSCASLTSSIWADSWELQWKCSLFGGVFSPINATLCWTWPRALSALQTRVPGSSPRTYQTGALGLHLARPSRQCHPWKVTRKKIRWSGAPPCIPSGEFLQLMGWCVTTYLGLESSPPHQGSQAASIICVSRCSHRTLQLKFSPCAKQGKILGTAQVPSPPCRQGSGSAAAGQPLPRVLGQDPSKSLSETGVMHGCCSGLLQTGSVSLSWI